MTVTEPHFLEHFFSAVMTQAEEPLLLVKHGLVTRTLSHRNVAAHVNSFARALSACGLAPESRVCFQGKACHEFLIAEWATLASRCVAVATPRSFSAQELVETLAESQAKIAVVESQAAAQAIAAAQAGLPGLSHIICMEGGAQAALPILSWSEFLEQGASGVDRMASLLRSISPKDTALLFYSRNEKNIRTAIRVSHGEIGEHARKIDALLAATSSLKPRELAITAIEWERPAGHIAACYLPVLKGASLYVTHEIADVSLLENHPHAIIGMGKYLDSLKAYIIEAVRQMGTVESKELVAMGRLGKIRYEEHKFSPWQKIQYYVLQQTITRKVHKLLGGRLHLLVDIDDSAHYDTQLFFHTFGVDLVQLHPDILG